MSIPDAEREEVSSADAGSVEQGGEAEHDGAHDAAERGCQHRDFVSSCTVPGAKCAKAAKLG